MQPEDLITILVAYMRQNGLTEIRIEDDSLNDALLEGDLLSAYRDEATFAVVIRRVRAPLEGEFSEE